MVNRRLSTFLFCTFVAATAAPAMAQVVNPADKQSGNSSSPQPQPQPSADDHHTWVMPPIEVNGKAPLTEEDRMGDYEQPRWTAHRRFSETRVYVIRRGWWNSNTSA